MPPVGPRSVVGGSEDRQDTVSTSRHPVLSARPGFAATRQTGQVPQNWDDTRAAHRDRQRDRIIGAAMSLVADKGLPEVSMVDVAKRAEIGRATLYKYFPSVEQIVAAHVISTVEQHHSRLEVALADVADPLDRLRTFVTLLLDYFSSEEHRSAASSVNPHQFSPEVGRGVGEAFATTHVVLAGLVEEACAAGELRADLDPGFTAELLFQMLGAGRTAVVSRGADPAVVGERIMAMFLDGAGVGGR